MGLGKLWDKRCFFFPFLIYARTLITLFILGLYAQSNIFLFALHSVLKTNLYLSASSFAVWYQQWEECCYQKKGAADGFKCFI